MGTATDAAKDRWPEILRSLAGLSDKQLTNRHQPCPNCGGTDRYRFDDQGRGMHFCSHCGAGDGMALLMKVKGWTYQDACQRVEEYLQVNQDRKPPKAAPKKQEKVLRNTRPPQNGPPVSKNGTVWTYSDTFRVVREPRANGEKSIRPWIWNGDKWQAGAPKGPRPLLNLQQIIDNPDRSVLVVEGEKCVDAAQQLFGKAVVTTWSSGANSVHKTDWSPLAGRNVALWPDNDQAGRDAMEKVARLVMDAGATSVRLIANPDDAPEKWDVADADWTPKQAAEFVQNNIQTAIVRPEVVEPVQQQADDAGQTQLAPQLETMVQYGTRELLNHFRGQGLRFNVFTNQVEQNGQVLRGAERTYLALAEQNIKAGKDLALDCLVQIAHENEYDPVREYLEHVEATVEPTYIERLASTYLRPADAAQDAPTLYDDMLLHTLIGAVRRVFEPGCKHDTACVLMGDQGCRKSSFWRVLGGPFFSDALRDIQSKDDIQILHRSWMMEWAELDALTSKKHAGSVKAFLSQAVDVFRVPYGKAAEDFPRRGIIVGSTNRQTGFLVDDTGNRRFWVIPTPKTEADPIDVDALEQERDAIWSAAVKLYREGVPNYMSTKRALEVTTENEDYLIGNPWAEVIETWLRTPRPDFEKTTTTRILSEAVGKPVERQTKLDQMHVADVMKGLGFKRVRERDDNKRTWVWRRS